MKKCKRNMIDEIVAIFYYFIIKFDNNIFRIDDEKYLKIKYRYLLNRKLNLNNPQSFNEKLQWLKLHKQNPEYSKLVDKFEVKEILKNELKGLDINFIKTLGIYDNFEQIDFNKLPQQFVIKCTHDSGSYKIIKDKGKINYKELSNFYKKKLKKNFFYESREYPYKSIKPRIIIEEFIQDSNREGLLDYKFQCFYGKVDNILVCVDREKETGVKYHYFDREWKYKPYNPYEGINEKNVNVAKPEKLEEMIKIAEKISKDIPEVRVDLYLVNGKIYFGELTFFSQGGFDNDITEKADKIIGEKFELPR